MQQGHLHSFGVEDHVEETVHEFIGIIIGYDPNFFQGLEQYCFSFLQTNLILQGIWGQSVLEGLRNRVVLSCIQYKITNMIYIYLICILNIDGSTSFQLLNPLLIKGPMDFCCNKTPRAIFTTKNHLSKAEYQGPLAILSLSLATKSWKIPQEKEQVKGQILFPSYNPKTSCLLLITKRGKEILAFGF